MSRSPQRRPGGPSPFTGPVIALAVVASVVVIFGLLLAFGLLDLSRFRSNERSTGGLVAIPTPAKAIPAYTRVTRDHLWDPANGRLAMIYLPPRAVTREMLVNISDVIGRVLDHDKAPGYVFTESDFLPRGTREGIVAGIPAGKRAVRISADKVDGLYGLHAGDPFDLLATMPRSGRPDDPLNSRTPDLSPVSPFTRPGDEGLRAGEPGVATDGNAKDFSVVETIMGQKRALTAVPRR